MQPSANCQWSDIRTVNIPSSDVTTGTATYVATYYYSGSITYTIQGNICQVYFSNFGMQNLPNDGFSNTVLAYLPKPKSYVIGSCLTGYANYGYRYNFNITVDGYLRPDLGCVNNATCYGTFTYILADDEIDFEKYVEWQVVST